MSFRVAAIALALAVPACGGSKNHNSEPDADVVTPPGTTCASPVQPVDTSTPDHVVGDGTAASCTETALATAIAAGGIITFSCGSAPMTIPITQTLELLTGVATTIDGDNLITLDGGSAVRILEFDHDNYRTNTIVLTLQNLTLAHGHATGTMMYATAPSPCSQGYYDGYGGALLLNDGELVVINTTFESNTAAALGPDVGGGALSVQGALSVIISGSTFHANQASNGGAIESLNAELDVYNTTFDSNVAEGNGANSNDMAMCAVQATNGQYQVGSGGNGGAVAIDGGADGTHTFCGNHFTNNVGGSNALGGAISRTADNDPQTTVFDRCTFDSNQGYNAGVGYIHNNNLQVIASTFSNNTASHGAGALQADSTQFQFLNDTFSGNNAMAGLGGAVALFSGGGSIEFTTFVDNQANGGDPYFGAAIAGDQTLTLVSDLFSNNTAQNPGAPMQCQVNGSGGGNFQWPKDHVSGGAADSPCTPTTVFADPLLGALGSNGGATETSIPGMGSPARGAGVMCPPTDQRGMPRPATGCTSGSVEPQAGE